MLRADPGRLAAQSVKFDGPGNLRGRGHYLRDIITIAVCAVLCGAHDWEEVECFGKAKLSWFRQMLRLPSGIPAQETFVRVFALLNKDRFREEFEHWLSELSRVHREPSETEPSELLHRMHQTDMALDAIDAVSVWVTENGVAFGQKVVHRQSNSDVAIPELLRRMELPGCIVAVDTIGCQRSIPQQIVNQGADYALTVKASQGQLHQLVRDRFSFTEEGDWDERAGEYAESVDRNDGRMEKRRCWSIFEDSELACIQDQRFWPALRSVAMVQAECHLGTRHSDQRRYYISSLPGDAAQLVRAVHDHWEIGSAVHWSLEISHREGRERQRRENEAGNLALLHDLTRALIENEGSSGSVEAKRKRAGWDDEFLRRLFACQGPATSRIRYQVRPFLSIDAEAD